MKGTRRSQAAVIDRVRVLREEIFMVKGEMVVLMKCLFPQEN
jgi:hypothetical protein